MNLHFYRNLCTCADGGDVKPRVRELTRVSLMSYVKGNLSASNKRKTLVLVSSSGMIAIRASTKSGLAETVVTGSMAFIDHLSPRFP